MEPIEFPENFTDLSAEALAELRGHAFAALTELLTAASSGATPVQATEAERLQAGIVSIDGEITARHDASTRLDAARAFADVSAEPPAAPEPVQTPGWAPAAPVDPEPESEDPAEPDPSGPNPPVEPTAPTQAAVAPVLDPTAVAGARPAAHARPVERFHAAADVPGLGVGQAVSFEQLAEALVQRFEGFPTPQGQDPDHVFGSDQAALRTFGHATISKNIPQDLMIDPQRMTPEQIQEVLDRAVDQSRLRGGNLVAAGGWCAPSELSYTFSDTGATNEGILSLPEVGMPRGGIRHTLGPDWSDVYALTNFFKNTEAQVIAGTATKPCFTVACPTFNDERLDAIGYCFQIPFLTEAAYPELIRKYLQDSLLAYQHKVNTDKITRLLALLGAAEVVADFGSLAVTLFGRIALIMDRERTKRRWGMNSTIEVKLPMWVKNAIKTDLQLRAGTPFQAISDAQVNAMFASVNASVQWLYGWTGQDLGTTAVVYPSTFEVLMFKAGTFIVGTLPVVNLSSVYDAASNALNQYTGAFFEEGMGMMRMGYGGSRLTVPTCVSGLTGASDQVCPSV